MTIVAASNTSNHAAGGTTLDAGRLASLPGVDEIALAQAYAACRDLTRRRARNFYYGLKLTPEPRRSAIFSIYAWMRLADDEADSEGPTDQKRARLAAFRETTGAVLGPLEGRGEPRSVDWSSLSPIWLALAATMATYPIERRLLAEMLDGLDEDLDHGGYRTDEELSRYCYKVASTVGLTCIAIWGLKPAADVSTARRLAVIRGQAFQRTNILRDFGEDFDAAPSRVYLPLDAFERCGLTPQDLRQWSRPEACRELVLAQAAVARRAYDDSEPLLAMIDPACAPTLWAMTRIYSDLLAVIERDPQRIVGDRRVRIPATKKAMIALSATIRSRRSGW
ncbi:MAG: phytoene/squalene synthase family protein [Phycisphaeraceae bacterium]|nr:phytoene/squalene synthase family protein [Phycisphaeraceae bacterium]